VCRSELVLLGAFALALGCQRKAPGPDECRHLAYQLYNVRTVEDLDDPRVHDRVDEQIRLCLVTPYDHELVRCLASGVRARLCERAFTERRLQDDDHYRPSFR